MSMVSILNLLIKIGRVVRIAYGNRKFTPTFSTRSIVLYFIWFICIKLCHDWVLIVEKIPLKMYSLLVTYYHELLISHSLAQYWFFIVPPCEKPTDHDNIVFISEFFHLSFCLLTVEFGIWQPILQQLIFIHKLLL